jgi:hypothetical protein
LARGFAHYEDYLVSVREVARHCYWVNVLMKGSNGLARAGLYDSLGRKTGEQITQDFARWLDRRPDRPFFAFLNYLDAHDPYLPEKLSTENRDLTHKEKLAMKYWRDQDPTRISDEYRRFARACYDSKIRDLDGQIGRLLEHLEQRGLRENTLVIITSDHGEHFGEHGVYYHGNTLYESAVHVPLMISWPGRLPTGIRTEVPVSLRDLAATILDLALEPRSTELPGNSLQLAWQDTPAIPGTQPSKLFCTVTPHPAPERLPMQKYAPAAKGTMYSILDGQDYVIREADDRVELFDFQKFSAGASNLADNEVFRGRLERTVRELDRFLDAFPAWKESSSGTSTRQAGNVSSDRRRITRGDTPAHADDLQPRRSAQ